MTSSKRLSLIALLLGLGLASWMGRAQIAATLVRHLVLPGITSRAPGLELRFQGLDTNLFSRLRVSGFSATYCRQGECLRIAIPEARVGFALSEMLVRPGRESRLRHLTIDLLGASLSGRLPSSGPTPAATTLPPVTATATAAVTLTLPPLPALPPITVKNGRLDLELRGTTIRGQGLTVTAPFFDPAGPTPYRVKLEAKEVTVNHPGWPTQEGSLATTLSLAPGRLEVPELFFREALLLDHGTVESDGQALRWAGNLHLLGSQGLVKGEVSQQEARLSFHLREGDIKALAGAAGVAPKVSGQLTADGEFTGIPGRPENLAGRVTARVRDGSWEGAQVDRLDVTVRAVDQRLSVEGLTLEMGRNRLTVREGVVPIPELGKQAWLPLLAAAQAEAEVEVGSPEDLPPSWSALFRDDWQALALVAAQATLSLQGGRLTVPAAEVRGGAGRARIKEAKVDLTGKLADWEAIPWSGQWEAELTRAEVVRHFWNPWPATGGRARGQGSFSGTLATPHLPFVATFTGSSLYGVALDRVTGRLEWTKNRLALDVQATSGKRDRLTYQGAIDLDRGGLLATRVETTVDDIHPYLPKALIGKTQMSGPLTGKADLDGPFSRLSGRVEATGDWTIEGTRLDGAGLSAGFSGRKWTVDRFSALVDQTVGVKSSGRVLIAGGRKPVVVDLDTLDLSYRGQHLGLVSPAGGTVSGAGLAITTPLLLAGEAGRFRLEGGLGGSGRLTLVGEDIRDTGLLKELSGRELGFAALGGTMVWSGALAHPEWGWQGEVRGLTVAGTSLALSGRFDLASEAQGLWVKQASLSNVDHSLTLSGHLPLDLANRGPSTLSGPLEVKATAVLPQGGLLPRLFPEWLAGSGAVHADLDLGGTWDHPQGQIRVKADGIVPGPRFKALPAGPFAGKALLALARDRFTISELEVASSGLTLTATGTITDLPWSALFSREPGPLPGRVEVKGRYAMPDLAWLAGKMPGVRRTAGSATGGFALAGALASPDLRADLALTKGEARGSESLLVFRDLIGSAALNRGQLTVTTLTGTMGGAPVGGAGSVTGLFTGDPGFDLRLSGKDLLLYRADGMKIRADTTLTLAGSFKAPQLSGEVLLTDSQITKRIDWLSFLKPGGRRGGASNFTLFSFKDPPLKNIRLDLRIKAARPLVVANNLYKGEMRPNLLLAGTGELPYLKGLIYADSGRLTLPAGGLDLNSGLIRFAEETSERPQLEVQASGRMMGYDITAQVEGPYDEPEVTLSSSPPLASEDLLMLLLTGRRPASEGQATGGVSTVAVYFGRGLFSRLFGEEMDNSALLDRLEMDVGRAVTQQGEPTVDVRLKLADGLWKKDTSLYLTGEKDNWDYYNAGVRLVVHFR